jgi:hypothetical protein
MFQLTTGSTAYPLSSASGQLVYVAAGSPYSTKAGAVTTDGTVFTVQSAGFYRIGFYLRGTTAAAANIETTIRHPLGGANSPYISVNLITNTSIPMTSSAIFTAYFVAGATFQHNYKTNNTSAVLSANGSVVGGQNPAGCQLVFEYMGT